jgi:DNA-binding transcriptional regulator YdaS (Cro superfamily)
MLWDKLRQALGSQRALAQRLGIGDMAISGWKRRGRIPASRVLEIERITNGQVTRHEMRPDLYPVERVSP